METLPLNFELQRDLAFFDLETTGIDVENDRIVEVSVLRVRPDGVYHTWTRRVRPGIPIPAAAAQVHGIHDEDVAAEPPFAEVGPQLAGELSDCDLGGFNLLRFDIPLLLAEFARAGVPFSMDGRRVVDAQVIFHRKEPRNLAAALRFYCQRDLQRAHSAEGDVLATFEVFNAQVAHYEDLSTSIDELDAFCRRARGALDSGGKILWRGGEAVLGFGKYRGCSLREIATRDESYLRWCVDKADFLADTKQILAGALEGRFPEQT